MKYFSVPEAAKVIHKSKDKVYQWIKEGLITTFDNGQILIREDHLDQFMEENFMRRRRKKLLDIPLKGAHYAKVSGCEEERENIVLQDRCEL